MQTGHFPQEMRRLKCGTTHNHTNPILYHGKLLIELVSSLQKISNHAKPGEKLRYCRLLQNMSHEKLGKIVGFEKVAIMDFERGFAELYYEQAVRFAKALDVEPGVLMDDYTRFCMPGYGKRIRKIRKMYCITQQKFAEMIGCARAKESAWEVEYHNIHPQRSAYL